MKDLKPLNPSENSHNDIYAKNQAFDLPLAKNKCNSATSSPFKSSNKTNTLPTSLPSAVSVLTPKNKSSILAGKTRPSAVEFCTRVWQSPETSKRLNLAGIDFPSFQAPVLTFHPALDENNKDKNNFYITQNKHHIKENPSPYYTNHQHMKIFQKIHPPNNHVAQMMGLRAVWINHKDNSFSYQNSIVNETYCLPNKSTTNVKEVSNNNSSNLIVFNQFNEYQNEDPGYEQQRRLPPLPSPSTPLCNLAFKNATYNTCNSAGNNSYNNPFYSNINLPHHINIQSNPLYNEHSDQSIDANKSFNNTFFSDSPSNATSSDLNDCSNNAESSLGSSEE